MKMNGTEVDIGGPTHYLPYKRLRSVGMNTSFPYGVPKSTLELGFNVLIHASSSLFNCGWWFENVRTL